jgi:nucleotide-binding universal stress UspA family protein
MPVRMRHYDINQVLNMTCDRQKNGEKVIFIHTLWPVATKLFGLAKRHADTFISLYNTTNMKILCPVDLKDASLNALNYAGSLAQKMQVDLSLLHAVPASSLSKDEGMVTDAVLGREQEVARMLEKISGEVNQQFQVNCDFLIEKDSLVKAINNTAEAGNYGLVVMGTAGADNLSRHFFGTHTVEVLEKVNVPLLIVPADFYQSDIRKIVYATNYQEGDDQSIVQLINFADTLQAELTILHVSDKGKPANMETFEAYRDFISERFYYNIPLKIEQVSYSDVEEGLLNYMQQNQTDLLAMLTRKRGYFGEMFHESLTKKMALLAEYPLLVFHQ